MGKCCSYRQKPLVLIHNSFIYLSYSNHPLYIMMKTHPKPNNSPFNNTKQHQHNAAQHQLNHQENNLPHPPNTQTKNTHHHTTRIQPQQQTKNPKHS